MDWTFREIDKCLKPSGRNGNMHENESVKRVYEQDDIERKKVVWAIRNLVWKSIIHRWHSHWKAEILGESVFDCVHLIWILVRRNGEAVVPVYICKRGKSKFGNHQMIT